MYTFEALSLFANIAKKHISLNALISPKAKGSHQRLKSLEFAVLKVSQTIRSDIIFVGKHSIIVASIA